MCILVIRSWPCGHSRCTSTDICMNALSSPGMPPSECSHASHFFPSEDNGWPCPVCSGRQNWQDLNVAGTPSVEQETVDYEQIQKTRQTQNLKQRQQQALKQHQYRIASQQQEIEKLRNAHSTPRQSEDSAPELEQWQDQLVQNRDAMLLPVLPSPTRTEQSNELYAPTPPRPVANQRQAPDQDVLSISSGSPESLVDIPITPLPIAEPSGLMVWPDSYEFQRAGVDKDYGFSVQHDSEASGRKERKSGGQKAAVDVRRQ